MNFTLLRLCIHTLVWIHNMYYNDPDKCTSKLLHYLRRTRGTDSFGALLIQVLHLDESCTRYCFFLFIHTPLYVQYLISLGHRKKVKVNYQSVRWYFRNLFNRFSFTVWKNKKLPLEIYINRRAWLLWFPQRPTLCKGIKNRVIVRNAAIYIMY